MQTIIETTTWRIDPDRSSVEFRAQHLWGLATVKGAFTRYQGTLDLSGEPAVELTIDAESLDTGNRRRDEHLRSPAFFGVEQHPYVRFASERATLKGEKLTVSGRLHAHGESVPLDIDATLHRVGDVLELAAVADVDQRRLGMTFSPLAMIRSPTTLVVKGTLVPDER
jgi:polyisoprenoid-binding protein YceI